MGLILDTSVIVADERGRLNLEAFSCDRLVEPMFIAAITASELLHGVERAPDVAHREQKRLVIETYLADFTLLAFDLAVARVHAVLWASLATTGTMIGGHDLLIAATALRHGFGLATLNLAEFQRVPGLHVEDARPYLIPSR